MPAELKASPSEETLSDHYLILTSLGTGSFAEVKLACHRHTEVRVALKILAKDKKNITLIGSEIEVMKILDHPNIIKLFHVIETTHHTYMIMEHASGGDLASLIVEKGCLQEEEAHHIFTQLVCAVHYCHYKGIAHRDIKPDNILIDAEGNVKLCDFGLATKVITGQRFTVFCGTLPYCAPELFKGQEYDAKALDIWSMGVVLYIMVTGRFPFKATTYSDMKDELVDPKFPIPLKLQSHIANLIVQLFTADPCKRPKIRDIIGHQWLKDSKEISKLSSYLETLPSKPNPSIMMAMWVMGYNPKDIRNSLREKIFNNVMATYLILKHQLPWEENTRLVMTPVVPLTFPCPTRRASEPTLSTFTLLAKHRLPGDDKNLGDEVFRWFSIPAVLCHQKKTCPPNPTPQYYSVAPQLKSRSLGERSIARQDVVKDSTPTESIHLESYSAQEALQDKSTPKSAPSPVKAPSEIRREVVHSKSISKCNLTSQKAPSEIRREVVHSKSISKCNLTSQKAQSEICREVLCGRGNPKCILSSQKAQSEICRGVLHTRSTPKYSLFPEKAPTENIYREVPHGKSIPEYSPSSKKAPSGKSSREVLQGSTATDTPHKSSPLPETSEPNINNAQPQVVTVDSSSNLQRGWKRVKNRIMNCVRSLCCCLTSQRRRHISRKKVAPMEGDDRGKVAPMEGDDRGKVALMEGDDRGATQSQ